MGAFTKSLLILLVALSTPLLYRHFANDNTIKFMSTYYSNYKSIDTFIRQSASHLDKAQDFLPNQEQLKEYANQVQKHVDTLIASAKSKLATPVDEKKETKSSSTPKNEKPLKHKLVRCPGENLGGKEVRLWSKEELAKFDGKTPSQDVYLAFLGSVYDVTINQQHYASGAEYNVFAGRDATRAFVTGNFTHDLHDDVSDIDATMFGHIDSWASFYSSSYPVVGRVEGKFYDSRGCATKELSRVTQLIEKLREEKSTQDEVDSQLPDCNTEWNADLKKGKVWCTTKSGGIDREWVGVPRIYKDGQTTRCACLNLDDPISTEYASFVSVYPGCDPNATECDVKQ